MKLLLVLFNLIIGRGGKCKEGKIIVGTLNAGECEAASRNRHVCRVLR